MPDPTMRGRIVAAAVEADLRGLVAGDDGAARRRGRGEPADGLQRDRRQAGTGRGDGPGRARPLPGVERAFDDHPDDLVAAIRAATTDVLRLARGNDLLKAVVSATHGADTELLPLLTTHAESLLETAKLVVAERVRTYDVPLDEHLDPAIDMVVRVVLSHVMQPSGSPEATAADLAWIASRVLRG